MESSLRRDYIVNRDRNRSNVNTFVQPFVFANNPNNIRNPNSNANLLNSIETSPNLSVVEEKATKERKTVPRYSHNRESTHSGHQVVFVRRRRWFGLLRRHSDIGAVRQGFRQLEGTLWQSAVACSRYVMRFHQPCLVAPSRLVAEGRKQILGHVKGACWVISCRVSNPRYLYPVF